MAERLSGQRGHRHLRLLSGALEVRVGGVTEGMNLGYFFSL